MVILTISGQRFAPQTSQFPTEIVSGIRALECVTPNAAHLGQALTSLCPETAYSGRKPTNSAITEIVSDGEFANS
jgi:hypothetical protein